MRSVITCLLFLLTMPLSAQFYQFTQYNFTSQRVTPASVSGFESLSVSAVSRNQKTAGGFSLRTNMVSIAYPILNKRGKGTSGIGLSIMDDRTGLDGMFSTSEIGVSYARTVSLSRYQKVSLGFKAVQLLRKINIDRLVTGSQFVPDRGFVTSMSNGETTGDYSAKMTTFSTGLAYEKTERKGKRLTYLAVSFFDFNKQLRDSEFASTFPQTLAAVVSFKAWAMDGFTIYPDIFYTNAAGSHITSAGFSTAYDLPSSKTDRLNFITRLSNGRAFMFGIQLLRENISYGFSYDAPTSKNPGNLGAFEAGIEFRKLMTKRPYTRSRAKRGKSNPSTLSKQPKRSPVVNKPSDKPATSERTHKTTAVKEQKTFSEKLKLKQDSLASTVQPGDVHHKPVVIEEQTLRFEFDFNSSEFNDGSAAYFEELAGALVENEGLVVELVGHTDNIGSEKFNMKLSIERANAIKEQLVRRGVDTNRIKTEGRGLLEPLNENKTSEDRAANRRVEMRIIGFTPN